MTLPAGTGNGDESLVVDSLAICAQHLTHTHSGSVSMACTPFAVMPNRVRRYKHVAAIPGSIAKPQRRDAHGESEHLSSYGRMLVKLSRRQAPAQPGSLPG